MLFITQIAIKKLNPRIINNTSHCMSCEGKPYFSTLRCQVSLGINGILNMFTVNVPFHNTRCVCYRLYWWVVLRWFEKRVEGWLKSVGAETTAIPGGVRSMQCLGGLLLPFIFLFPGTLPRNRFWTKNKENFPYSVRSLIFERNLTTSFEKTSNELYTLLVFNFFKKTKLITFLKN